MRLSTFKRESTLLNIWAKRNVFKSFQLHVLLAFSGLLTAPVRAATTDVRESHLLPVTGVNARGQIHINGRTGVAQPVSPESERNDRAEKQFFRLELLRQIKAIDHMKCFPKVLCGLSVDSDKSFGINKSNFVRSYLELMRNIKPPQEGVEERLRTEDEVEGELLWPFSPHNPDRKYHSSFERISSAAMSGSVELGDSLEYNSRGLDSRVADSSMSMEKADRKGIAAGSSLESKEKSSINKMDNSRIPGEKKKKKNSNKSLTSKISSYISSWLPDVVSSGKDADVEDSTEIELDVDDRKRAAKNLKDDVSGKSYRGIPPHVVETLRSLMRQQELVGQRRKDKGASTGSTVTEARDDIHAESSEHDSDIYHTAVNIGKRLKDPKQCDYIYNGCPLEYNKLLDMISSIRTEIHPLDDTAEAVSHELGLDGTTAAPTTTTTATTTTTKKPYRKKPRPSTKIMHVLPNGEKVEINFRLAGSEDSDESSSSGQKRDYAKKEAIEDQDSFEKSHKNSDEVMVVDLGKHETLDSSEEGYSGERRHISHRKGTPHIDTVVVKNKSSNKKKVGYLIPKRNIMSEMRNEELERSEELDINPSERHRHNHNEPLKSSSIPALSSLSAALSKQKPKLKLSGLTLSTSNDDEQPLEISPSYVIIKHQPLAVHTTSVLSPDNVQQQQAIHPNERLQTFQLVQNGQRIDADQITDQLKSYIRHSGGLIPKLSLQSSGLITTDSSDNLPTQQQILREQDEALTSIAQKLQQTYSNRMAALALETSSTFNKLPSVQSSKPKFQTPSIPYPGLSASYINVNDGPAMVGSVPGRLGSLIKATTSTTTPTTTTTSTTTSTTPSTTTQKISLLGMAETITLDTEEMTDDTVQKLEGRDSLPGWISHAGSSASESRESTESDEEKAILENLNKTLMKESGDGSKLRYKNPKKKKTSVAVNSSRVSSYKSKTKQKGNSNSGSEESSSEADRVVIKHAGPYNSSPTVYKSPLTGPGPHGGAYPYLPMTGMQPSVFPGYPFWRLK